MRTILSVLVVTLLAVTLVSCFSSDVGDVGAYFSDEILTEKNITDMPRPDGLDEGVCVDGDELYLNMTDDEYSDYVMKVVEYLKGREEIYYLSHSVDSGYDGVFLLLRRYDICQPIPQEYDYSSISHTFVFSTSPELGGSDDMRIMNDTLINIVRESKTEEYGRTGIKYNTVITIKGNTSPKYDLCHFNHAYNDGVEYIIPGSDQTMFIYECQNCGATRRSGIFSDYNAYTVYTNDVNGIKYVTKQFSPTDITSGSLFEIHTVAMDGIRVYANDVELMMTSIDTDSESGETLGYCYGFIMPCRDVEIKITFDTDVEEEGNLESENQ